MDILQAIQQQLGDDAIAELSNSIGGTKEQTTEAVNAALPTILGAMSRSAESPSGQNAIMSFLDKNGDGNIFDDLQGYIGGGNDTHGGSSIIDQFLGGKKQTVEQAISEKSGLNKEASSNLLTQLAPMIMNMLGKAGNNNNNNNSGGGGFDIGSIIGLLQNQGQSTKKGGNLGFVANLLDQDGDGDIMDDAMDIGKKFLGGFFGRK